MCMRAKVEKGKFWIGYRGKKYPNGEKRQLKDRIWLENHSTIYYTVITMGN